MGPCGIWQEAGTGIEEKGSRFRRDAKNLLVTGRPGVGKTTLVVKLAERPIPGKVVGFFTREMREEGRRVGFSIETIDGKKGELARVSGAKGFRVGKYTVNVDDLERIAVPCIEEGLEGGRLLIVDEIGKMELHSGRFREAVMRAFDSPTKVIATIRMGEGGFTGRLLKREDTEVLLLTELNRDFVLNRMVEFAEGSKVDGGERKG
jgi:nucleoside-triphosphatase THEP1